MSDFKFNCPHCNALLEGEEGWRGMELDCPACNKQLRVPAGESEPTPSLDQPVTSPMIYPTKTKQTDYPNWGLIAALWIANVLPLFIGSTWPFIGWLILAIAAGRSTSKVTRTNAIISAFVTLFMLPFILGAIPGYVAARKAALGIGPDAQM